MVFLGVSLIFIEPYHAAFRCFTESTMRHTLRLCSDKLHSTELLLVLASPFRLFPKSLLAALPWQQVPPDPQLHTASLCLFTSLVGLISLLW